MSKVLLIWILFGIVIVLGIVILVVLLEKYTHRRKQDKYDDLHASMGLQANEHDQALPSQIDSSR